MKNLILLFLTTLSIHCYAQDYNKSDKKAIIEIVDKFFESLHKQDTLLYKEVVFTEGQIWSINNTLSSRNKSMRYFREDLKTFNSREIWEEIPYSYDIKIHKGVAVAWVPYEFRINGNFSHCGVDIFTLVQTTEGWKISNATYTKETAGCEDLKSINR